MCCAFIALACGRTADRPSVEGEPPSTVADTLRGEVAVVGADPVAQVVLRPVGAPGADIVLTGPQASTIERLSGLEVWVRGRIETNGHSRMEVRRFAVRALDGVPAVDGVLVTVDEGIALETGDGERLRLVHPPRQFRDLVGARVWVAGPLDRSPAAFGVITPAP